MATAEREDWETPQKLFEELDAEFHFNLDVASSDLNCKCERHFTIKDNGLEKSWGGARIYCNPPYGKQIKDWVKKAWEETKTPGTLVVMLLPARTDTKWFHEYVLHRAEVRLLPGRVKYELNGEAMNSAPFPSMIVVFRAGGKL